MNLFGKKCSACDKKGKDRVIRLKRDGVDEDFNGVLCDECFAAIRRKLEWVLQTKSIETPR